MPSLTTSADIDAFMASANNAAARTNLGLTALATTTPGTGVATALGVNVGSAGAFITFNGAAGTPSSLTGTNITGTAAGLTAGTASAVAVGGITGLGTGVATWLATPSSANLASAVTGETGSGALVFGTSPAFTTNFTLANGASPTTSSVAQMAFDTDAWAASRGAVAVHDGTATTWLVGVLASDTPSNGQVPTWNTGGTITWETPGGAANAVTAASAAGSSGLFWVSAGADRTASATNTITTINATTANVTNLLPVSNDGAAIGASGTAFSDAFLANGAVINFNAGNLTLTHSAGTLTNSGAYVGTTGTFTATTSLLLGTAGSAVGNIGFRNGTSGTITLAPTTGALGTVTQTLQAVTGTVYCTGGTDVAVADGGTGLSSGTSGGVLAFTASGTLASSGALAANAIVIGGGAGVAPSTTTTGTGVLTQLGLAADGSDVDAIGFRGIPQNAQTGNYTCVMADAGKCIFHASGAGAGDTYTIPANGSVAYEVGTVIKFKNMDSNTVAIAITTDTMTFLPAGTTGSRTLAQYGEAYAEKISSTAWTITGNSALT